MKNTQDTYPQSVWKKRKSAGDGVVLDRTRSRLAEVGSFAGAVIDRVAEGLCVWHEIEAYPHISVTIWNERMAEITGYSKEEMNRRGWFDTLCCDVEVTTRMKERMDRMWQGEDLNAEEWPLTRKDGAIRWLSISTSLIEIDDAPHALACVHDMSDVRAARDGLEREVQERTAELNRQQKQLETANRRLHRENARRRRLSERLVDLIERERHQVSMSLHEDMAQSMAILGIQLDYVQRRLGAEKGDLSLTLEKAKALVGTVIDDMKRLSRGFGSDVLSHLGLVAAIQSLAEDVETAGVEMALDLAPDVDERISRKKGLALFRIAQEAVTNVIRHGRASRVHVGLNRDDGEVRLMVEDDGCGFDPRKVADISHGLLIMEERSVQCGGELIVESDRERGTVVMARIPVDPVE